MTKKSILDMSLKIIIEDYSHMCESHDLKGLIYMNYNLFNFS